MTQAKKRSKPKTDVAGFQEGAHHPKVLVTTEDYANLLENPDKPVELQSAPSPEKMNPHLFPVRLP